MKDRDEIASRIFPVLLADRLRLDQRAKAEDAETLNVPEMVRVAYNLADTFQAERPAEKA